MFVIPSCCLKSGKQKCFKTEHGAIRTVGELERKGKNKGGDIEGRVLRCNIGLVWEITVYSDYKILVGLP